MLFSYATASFSSSSHLTTVINRMRIYVLGLLITLTVPVSNNYLTGTVHKDKLHSQQSLLLNDVLACSEQRRFSLHENLNHLYHCLRRRIIHCDNRRRKSLEYIQLVQDKSQTHCTSIVLQGVDISHQHRTLHIQIMKNFIIHFSFMMFNFEYFSQVYHGLSISEYIRDGERSTTYYAGRRLPWTMITTSNTALITISIFAHLKFHLNLIYSANKMNWFSHSRYVQYDFLGGLTNRAVHINLLDSLKIAKFRIQRFSYHYIQNDLKRVSVSYEYIIQPKARIVIYDGPGRLSTRLSTSLSQERMSTKTSTFHVYLEIDILISDIEGHIYINLRSTEDGLQYKECNKNMNDLSVIYYSQATRNTICVIVFTNPPRNKGNVYPVYISEYRYEGPMSLMTGFGHLKCQYGGVYFFANQKEFLCKSGTEFTLSNVADHSYILVVWLMGYSKGYIKAQYSRKPCFYHHVNDIGQSTLINSVEYCQIYICPQQFKSEQTRCNLDLNIPGRPVGTADIKIHVLKSIDECLPGPEINPRATEYNFSVLYYTHSRLGDNKRMHISNKFEQPYEHIFQYLASGNVSLPVFCQRRWQHTRSTVQLRISTCQVKQLHKTIVIAEECLYSQFMFRKSYVIIYHENYRKNHSRNIISTSYDNCPNTCRNHTFDLKVYRKFLNRVDVYSAKIGETVSTELNHQGFWLKINVPQKPCSLGRCVVAVSAPDRFTEELLDVNGHTFLTPPPGYKYFSTAR